MTDSPPDDGLAFYRGFVLGGLICAIFWSLVVWAVVQSVHSV